MFSTSMARVQELRQLIFDRDIKHVALTLALRFEVDGHLGAFQTQDERITLLSQLKLPCGMQEWERWDLNDSRGEPFWPQYPLCMWNG